MQNTGHAASAFFKTNHHRDAEITEIISVLSVPLW